jgi:drug/metabolite transporter (DMT)-like permease
MNALLTVVTLVAFAANSLLCRMALAPQLIDPVAFTIVRLGSGVAVLVPLASLISEQPPKTGSGGSWKSGFALFVYAMAFSLAYVSLETGMGALILFGSVQATMIGWGILNGERPQLREWLGLGVAMAGLVYLLLPGIAAPDPGGALLMAASGAGWGIYSLRGKASAAPVAATSSNFARALPFALVSVLFARGSLHATARGVALAIVSGALTSGLGYVLWYRALRGLSATRAAIVQLAVPVIAAAGGIVVLAEAPTVRLAIASALILCGIGGAVLSRETRPRGGPFGRRL